MTETAQAPLKLLWGTRPIAKEIGRTERQTYHLLETGQLPAKKIGGRWVADLDQLHAHFRNGEAA